MKHAPTLRFHPHCYYGGGDTSSEAPEAWPALLAKVTDLSGEITGVHRTWLDPRTIDKAPVDRPRKAMGYLLGHGVRFGKPTDVLAAGEGLETMLSIWTALSRLPMVAALSANHLQALVLPSSVKRLYIAEDADDAGRTAAEALAIRARTSDIDVFRLAPTANDFNDDLRVHGAAALVATLIAQLAPQDAARLGTANDRRRTCTCALKAESDEPS